MAILASLVCITTPPVAFASPPWADDDPRRLELAQRLDEQHLARRLEQAVARLDLGPLWHSYAGTGSLPHRPDLLLRVVLYEVQRGHHAPATWHRHATEAEPVRWLLRGSVPARTCWYAFRDRVAPFLDAFHRQVLQQAIDQGLTPANRGALDGTLVAANASRHRLVNATTLHKHAAAVAAAVAADAPPPTPAVAAPPHRETPPAVAEAQGELPSAPAVTKPPAEPLPAATAAQTPTPTRPARAAWMAQTPAGRRQQQQRLTLALQRMDALHARNRGKRASKQKKTDQIVLSVADSEAVVGRDKEKVFRPLYNVQVVDDLDSPFVLGYGVFAQANDAGVLATMLPRLKQGLGHGLETLLADTAYAGGADLAVAAFHGVTLYAPTPTDGQKKDKQIPKSQFAWQAEEQTYACPQGHRLVWEGSSPQKRSGTETVLLHRYRCPPHHCQACPLQKRCTSNPGAGRSISRGEHEDLIEALRQRMETAAAKALYRLRSQTVELVNADWKQHRQLRRFSGRGLKRVSAAVGLVVLAHNLLTLLKLQAKKATQNNNPAVVANPPGVTT